MSARCPWASIKRGLASNKAAPEECYECKLANRLQVPIRLTGRGQCWPLYSYPRLARYAFFTGTGLAELDFPPRTGEVLEVRPEGTTCPAGRWSSPR